MSTTTDGQICYGIVFEEGFEFPWDVIEKDIDEWWIEDVLKFKPSVEIYTEDGEYIGGQRPSDEVVDQYYDEKTEFIKNSKTLPVQLVNYCSGDVPMYILAIPETVIDARRGYPQVINPQSLVTLEKYKTVLKQFCEDYSIEYSTEPDWYLSSYWG